MFAPKLKKTWN